jgi:hypothetical protein
LGALRGEKKLLHLYLYIGDSKDSLKAIVPELGKIRFLGK